MTKKIFTLLFFFAAFTISAQNKKEIEKKIEEIKNNGAYYWGEGIKSSSERAEEESLKNMYKDIAANIKVSLVDMDIDNLDEHKMKVLKTVKIPSSTINVDDNVKKNNYVRISYISKDDLMKVFEERKKDIQRKADKGLEYEGQNVSDALREYYWGMMLCVGHINGKELMIKVEDEDVMAYDFFYEKMVDLLGSISFRVDKRNPGELNDEGLSVLLNVTSNDEVSIDGLPIEYSNGVDRYIETLVRNNKANIQLNEDIVKEIGIKIIYNFKDDLNSNSEIKTIFDNVGSVIIDEYKNSIVPIKDYMRNIKKNDQEPQLINEGKLSSNEEYFYDVMLKLENAFCEKNYNSVKGYFTKEAFAMLDTLVRNAEISVVGKQEYEIIPFGDITICRDIDMCFKFKNYKSFIREVVFRFDNNTKLIKSLAFRITSYAEKDITTNNKWGNDCRFALINFLEDYQTAYALERHEYLEKIFSDDALIIVGHVLEKRENQTKDVMKLNLGEKEVVLQKMEKKAYFDRLKRVFDAQEYIDIKFTETVFERMVNSDDENNNNGDDILGIRLLQEYNSEKYGDVGYLFLLVDLRDTQRPVIHVRAWQPSKTDEGVLVGLKNLEE